MLNCLPDITPPLVMHKGWYLRYCTQCITMGTKGGSNPCLLSIYRLDLTPHPPVHFAGGKMHWGVGGQVQPVNTEQTRVGPPFCTHCNALKTGGWWGVRYPPLKGVVMICF